MNFVIGFGHGMNTGSLRRTVARWISKPCSPIWIGLSLAVPMPTGSRFVGLRGDPLSAQTQREQQFNMEEYRAVIVTFGRIRIRQ